MNSRPLFVISETGEGQKEMMCETHVDCEIP